MDTLDKSQAAAGQARFIRDSLPEGGLFAGQDWRISPEPFSVGEDLAREFEGLGRILLQFYRAVNLLYRQSLAGKQAAWVAQWLDQGKPEHLLAWQCSAAFKNELPRVIRPDVLLNDQGWCISELDSIPGGIGLTAWLNLTYSTFPEPSDTAMPRYQVLGGPRQMLDGFAGIFGTAENVHLVVSAEAATYRPEMEWVTAQLGRRFTVRDTSYENFEKGDAVYRFFELFDYTNVANAAGIFSRAEKKELLVTPPPKMIFEEKMLFALLWNGNLHNFWRQHLGESFFQQLLQRVPYTWMVDPTPLPPQGALPELNLVNWEQLSALSQRERELILKVSGFSDKAWGSRGVYLGSDLSHADWTAAVHQAIKGFCHSPYVLQKYHRPRLVESSYFDFSKNQLVRMPGRVRLCPYYFVVGEGDNARAQLGGVLATICPADKKIIHGMKEAILAPCRV